MSENTFKILVEQEKHLLVDLLKHLKVAVSSKKSDFCIYCDNCEEAFVDIVEEPIVITIRKINNCGCCFSTMSQIISQINKMYNMVAVHGSMWIGGTEYKWADGTLKPINQGIVLPIAKIIFDMIKLGNIRIQPVVLRPDQSLKIGQSFFFECDGERLLYEVKVLSIWMRHASFNSLKEHVYPNLDDSTIMLSWLTHLDKQRVHPSSDIYLVTF